VVVEESCLVAAVVEPYPVAMPSYLVVALEYQAVSSYLGEPYRVADPYQAVVAVYNLRFPLPLYLVVEPYLFIYCLILQN
jgi:hypothetical protein